MTTVRVERLPHAEGLPLPAYETPGSAGMDLRAAVAESSPVILAAGARTLIPTGLKIALEQGWEAQVRPRSGLALKHGITCLNSPGTIDSDYRGEVQVILINLGSEPLLISRGDRIAQLIIAPVVQATLVPAISLSDTARSSGGFGSTGTSTIADENTKSKKAKKKKAVPSKTAPAKRSSKPRRKRTSARAS